MKKSHNTAAIYRTTERIKYVEKSFPSLDQSLTDQSIIIVVLNTDNDKAREEIKKLIDCYHTERPVYVKSFDHLLGTNKAINTAIGSAPDGIEYFVVVDDDCLSPEHGWDQEIRDMLDASWDIAGIANYPPAIDNVPTKMVGGKEGVDRDHITAAFAGFKKSTWKKVDGISQQGTVFGFGGFCRKFNNVGWSLDFMAHDMDRTSSPHSLRETDYFDWYKRMRPKQAKKLKND